MSADRLGVLYFADALGSVGRFSFDDANVATSTIQAPIRKFQNDLRVWSDEVSFVPFPSQTNPNSFNAGLRVVDRMEQASIDHSQGGWINTTRHSRHTEDEELAVSAWF